MALADSLSAKFDAQSLVSGLTGALGGPTTSLTGVSVPIDSRALQTATAGTASFNASPIGGAVQQLGPLVQPILRSLPVTGDLMKPLTDIVALVEKVAEGELTDAISGLRPKLAAAFTSDGDVVGALLRAAQVLSSAPEGQVLKEIGQLAAGLAHVQVPQLPLGDALQAIDNTVRIVGGTMALDSVLTDADQLAALTASTLDAAVVSAAIAALAAALAGTGGTALPDTIAATDATDAAAVAAAVAGVTAAANQLDAINRQLLTSVALGQAALGQLQIDLLAPKIAAASAVVRSADLASLQRLLEAAALRLAGLTSFDLAQFAFHTVDALITAATARVQAVADQLNTVDLTTLVSPVTGAIDKITGLLGRIGDAITEITLAFQTAMNTVKNAVAALPVQAIADAINTFLAPITDVLGKITQIIDQVHAALQVTADSTQAVIGQVGALLDGFKNDVDTLFGGARDFVAHLNLDAVVGEINDRIRAFSDVLAKAQLKPYFDAADGAIGAAADVISNVPFGLLPDSMKQQVTDALEPIKDADASAVQTEIEGLLDMQPDPNDANKRIFAARDIVNQAIAEVQTKYEQLLTAIKAHDPRQYLTALDAKLADISTAISAWQPALTLQPLTDAVNQVKSAIAGFDLESQLKPVHDVFTQVEAAIASIDPTKFVQPIEDRIQAARTSLYQLIHIDAWQPAIDGVVAEANDALVDLDPAVLTAQLQAAIDDTLASLGSGDASGGLSESLGALVAPMTMALGLPVEETSFGDAAAWLGGGVNGAAALAAHAASISAALTKAAGDLGTLDVVALATPIVPQLTALGAAASGLAARLDPQSAPALALSAVVPRLRGDLVFSSLATVRAPFLAALSQAVDAAAAVAHDGFSEVTDAAQKWQAALAPLRPLRDFIAHLFAELGVTSPGGGLIGLLRALLLAVPADRLAGIFTPLATAIRTRLQALITAVQTSLDAGVIKLKAVLDSIDLKPFTDAIDGVFTEVESQVAALDPDVLLAAPLTAFKKLQTDLGAQDPLAQVLQIITNLRDAAAALLAKLDANKLLATPLAIYDSLIADLSKLDIEGLLDPVFNQLDGIAEQAHEGLTDTVAAFVRLQAALPGGDGGGASASVQVGVS